MPPSSRSQQKKRRAQRRKAEQQEQERAERRAYEQEVEQTAPSAIEAGIHTARAHQLLLEGQRRTHDERLSKAYCVGIRNLSIEIAKEATLTHTSCKLFAACICRAAFPGQPSSIHEDIFVELVERLQGHFASLGYEASADTWMAEHATVELGWNRASSALPPVKDHSSSDEDDN